MDPATERDRLDAAAAAKDDLTPYATVTPGSSDKVLEGKSFLAADDVVSKKNSTAAKSDQGAAILQDVNSQQPSNMNDSHKHNDVAGKQDVYDHSALGHKDEPCVKRVTSDGKSYALEQKASVSPKVPFGLHPLVLFGIVLIYTVCVGSHFFNWVAWERIFRHNQLLSAGCPPESLLPNSEVVCKPQAAGFNYMFLIFQLCMFSFSFVAGMVLDIVGPKMCCLFGNVMLILGWICFAVSSSSPALSNLSMGLIGAGTDPAFFGTLSVANLFPEHSSIIIAILGAARSVSNLWPMLFYQLTVHIPSVFSIAGIGIFFVILYGGCFVLVLLFIPSAPFSVPSKDPTIVHAVTLVNTLELANIGAAPAQAEVDDGVALLATSDVEEKAVGTHIKENLKHSLPKRLASSRQLSRMLDNPERGSRPVGSPSAALSTPEGGKCKVVLTSLAREFKVLGAHLLSPLYFPVVIISVSNLIRNGYYNLTAKERLGSASITLQIVNVLAFVPGPICGYIVNRWSPFVVMHGLNGFMAMVFTCLIIAGQTTGMFSVVLYHMSAVLFLPFVAFLLSQVYCYIALVFDPADMGKLSGFASFIAGVCSFATKPLAEAKSSTVGFLYMDIVNLVVTFLTVGLTLYLVWKVRLQRVEAEKQGQQQVAAA